MSDILSYILPAAAKSHFDLKSDDNLILKNNNNNNYYYYEIVAMKKICINILLGNTILETRLLHTVHYSTKGIPKNFV